LPVRVHRDKGVRASVVVQNRRLDRTTTKPARRRSWQGRGGAGGLLALAAALAACSPKVAQLTNPASPRCQQTLRDAFESILLDQQEPPDQAAALGASAAGGLASVDLGATAFRLPSQATGVDYAFAFESDDASRCLLHLVAWQKGGLQYGNNVTFLETRVLYGCRCVQ
jgi:hypothetical protein